MRCKFSTFVKKAKLKYTVDDMRHVYVAPRGQLILFNDQVIGIVFHYLPCVEKNPLGGIEYESEGGWQVIIAGDDDGSEFDEDPVGRWELYKKVI